MLMYLNDKKVAKVFGNRPDLGRFIPNTGKKRVTLGIRWSLPRRKFEPDDDVLVQPCVALRCLGKGKWDVQVAEEYRAIAERWLVDTCI